MINRKRILALITAALMLASQPVLAETAETDGTAEAPAALTAEEIANAQMLDAVYTRALSAIESKDYAAARKYLYVGFVYCDPRTDSEIYADMLLKLACIDIIEGDASIAQVELEAALKLNPELADAYRVRTEIYIDEEKYTEAAENLEKYIELTKDESMYATVAELLEAGGEIPAAQEAYDKYVAFAGADNPEAAFQAAVYRMENGLYAEAAEGFLPYTENETYAAAAWYNTGLCRMNTGDFAGAAEAFTASETHGGLYSGLYYNRGFSYMSVEEWAKAAEDFAQSVEKEPFTDDARYNLGRCRMMQGDFEGALAAFNELAGEGGEAAGDAEEGTDAGMASDAVYYYRAACNSTLGRLEEAIRDYTVCISHGYETAKCYYQRAKIYEAMGDIANRDSDLDKFLNFSQ